MKGLTNAGTSQINLAYGVEWDVDAYTSDMTRIGNVQLHRELPIQSRMRGCLITDDGSKTYLPTDSWPAELTDGSAGQVMVEVPSHYRRFESAGTKRRCWLSEYPLAGYHKVPTYYIGAYEAAIDKNPDGFRMASVANDGENYRFVHPEWDGSYRSMLGRPTSNLKMQDARMYAMKRGAGWGLISYNAYKSVVWLILVEFATRKLQQPISYAKDDNGFTAGGLGDGATTWINYGAAYNYNYTLPLIPCGHCNSLGSRSGECVYTALDASGNVVKHLAANKYRGIENIYGHTSHFLDGAYLVNNRLMVAEDYRDFGNSELLGYTEVGEVAVGDGYVSRVIFGEDGDLLPAAYGGSSSAYWSAEGKVIEQPLSALRLWSTVYSGASAGLAAFYCNFTDKSISEDSTHRIAYYDIF